MRSFQQRRISVLAILAILLTGLAGCDPGPNVWPGVKAPKTATAPAKEVAR
jgi:hypothetical protein